MFHGPGPGRPKGSKDKISRTALEVIRDCADKMGGVDRMYKWAMKNDKHESIFWGHIFTKLLPLQIEGNMTVEHDFTADAEALAHLLARRADAIRARGENLKVVEQSEGAVPTLVALPRKTGTNGA
jgi:hypothetical protein